MQKMRNIIKTIRNEQSIYSKDVKSVRKVLQLIANAIQNKISVMEKQGSDRQSLINIDHYFYEYMNQKYGLQALAHKYTEIYLLSIEKHYLLDSRIDLFRKFVGLSRTDKLPFSVFVCYTQMIKATNINLQLLFTSNIKELFIDYNRVRAAYKEMLTDASQYIVLNLFQSLKKFTQVITDNKRLERNFDLNIYNCFKDVLDKILNSRFQNINDAISPLFSDTTYIKKEHFRDYLIKMFDQGHTEKGLLDQMIQTFFIEAQDVQANMISKEHLMRGLREKFDLKVPVSAFFHIGLNAIIEHENNENQWLEKLFQFYSMIDFDPTFKEQGFYLKQKFNYDGMELAQFLLFLKDAQNPVITEVVATEIYIQTLEQNYRQKMSCDDFIEAIRKYKLLPNKRIIEENRRNRELKIERIQETLSGAKNVPKHSIGGLSQRKEQVKIMGEVQSPMKVKKAELVENSPQKLMHQKTTMNKIQNQKFSNEMKDSDQPDHHSLSNLSDLSAKEDIVNQEVLMSTDRSRASNALNRIMVEKDSSKTESNREFLIPKMTVNENNQLKKQLSKVIKRLDSQKAEEFVQIVLDDTVEQKEEFKFVMKSTPPLIDRLILHSLTSHPPHPKEEEERPISNRLLLPQASDSHQKANKRVPSSLFAPKSHPHLTIKTNRNVLNKREEDHISERESHFEHSPMGKQFKKPVEPMTALKIKKTLQMSGSDLE